MAASYKLGVRYLDQHSQHVSALVKTRQKVPNVFNTNALAILGSWRDTHSECAVTHTDSLPVAYFTVPFRDDAVPFAPFALALDMYKLRCEAIKRADVLNTDARAQGAGHKPNHARRVAVFASRASEW